VEMLPAAAEEKETAPDIRVAIIGRPNVGKSSLMNRVLGAERVLVSDLPGTTRDAVDVTFRVGEEHYVLVDTPGIRRRTKTTDKVEKFSVLKALKSVERCQVAVLLVDASEGLTDQDVRIAGYIHERQRGAVVALKQVGPRRKGAATAEGIRRYCGVHTQVHAVCAGAQTLGFDRKRRPTRASHGRLCFRPVQHPRHYRNAQ